MMSIVCIGLGLSCAVLGYKWIQAERKASKLYDMVTEACDQCNKAMDLANKACDQRDKVREELKGETMMADYYYEETVRLKAELEQMREALNAEEMMSDYYYEKSVEAEQRNVVDLSEYRNRR